MSIALYHEQRTKLLADAQAIMLDKANLTAEKRASVDKMIADVDVLDADIKRLERSSVIETETRSALTIPRGQPGDAANNLAPEVRNQLEMDLFDYQIRGSIKELKIGTATRNRWQNALEKRDILEAGTGSNFVPQAFYPVLMQAQKAWGDLLTIVTNITPDTGAPRKYATSDATAIQMFEESVGTPDANAIQTPIISGAIINHSLFSLSAIKVGWDEMQDSNWDITNFVMNILGQAWFRNLSAFCVNGSPSGNIASLLAGVGAAGANVPTAVGGVITYVDIANLFGAVDPDYLLNATYVMNSTTRATLLGEVNTLGNPIFTPSASVQADPFGTLLGRPVKLVQALPNIGSGNIPILCGDFKQGYVLSVVKPGLAVTVVKELFAQQFETGFIPFGRVGSAFIAPGTAHPIVGLKVGAPA